MKKRSILFLAISLLIVSFTTTAMSAPINFNDYNAKVGQNQYLPQGTEGTYKIADAGAYEGSRLILRGDVWVNFDITVSITPKTIMKIDVRNIIESEILGFQFLDSYDDPKQESGQAFAFAGTQTSFGIQDFRTVGNTWNSFEINVGEYLTGDFAGMVFFLDSDVNVEDGTGVFKNIDIYEPVPEPGTILLLGLGLTGLAVIRKRKNG